MLSLPGLISPSGRISASAAEPASDRTVSIVSLNLARETNPDKIARAIHKAPRLRDADLFLFQEVAHGGANGSVAEEIARKLKHFVSFEPAGPGILDQGLAVISRYPLDNIKIRRLKLCNLGFRVRKRFAMAATVRTPWGELRVWNAHLDTRINAGERLQQIEPVIEDASRSTGPRLIGGDFNTNDLYWVKNMAPLPGGRSHGAAIRRAMWQNGFETPLPKNLNTFPMFRRHLDWIFLRELACVAVSVEPASFSDHHAVWVRVRL